MLNIKFKILTISHGDGVRDWWETERIQSNAPLLIKVVWIYGHLFCHFFLVYSYPLKCTCIIIVFCMHDLFLITNMLLKLEWEGMEVRWDWRQSVGLQGEKWRQAVSLNGELRSSWGGGRRILSSCLEIYGKKKLFQRKCKMYK